MSLAAITNPLGDYTPIGVNQPVFLTEEGLAAALCKWTSQVNSDTENTIITGVDACHYVSANAVANAGSGGSLCVDKVAIRLYDTSTNPATLVATRILVMGQGPAAVNDTLLACSPTTTVVTPSPVNPSSQSQQGGTADAPQAVGMPLMDPNNRTDEHESCGCSCGCSMPAFGQVEGGGSGLLQSPAALTPASLVAVASQISTWLFGQFRIKTECSVLKSRGVPVELCLYFANVSDGLVEGERPVGPGWSFGWQARIIENGTTGDVILYWGDRRVEPWFKSGGVLQRPKGVFGDLQKKGDNSFYRVTKDNTYYDFDSNGRLQSCHDKSSDGNYIYFNYNANNQMIRIVGNALSLKPYFVYDSTASTGRVTSVSLEATNAAYNRVTTLGYDASGAKRLNKLVDPAGLATYFEYDGSNNVTQETKKDGADTFLTYFGYVTVASGIPRIKEVNLPQNTGAYFAYDDDNTASTKQQVGSDPTYFTYVWSGQADTVRNSGATQVAKTYYDHAEGKPTRSVDVDGNLSYYSWDSNGQVTFQRFPEDFTQYFTYGSAGNVTSQKDELGRVQYWNYDAQFFQSNWIDAKGNPTYFERDTYGQIVSRKDRRGNTTYFTYDSRGNLTSVKKPDLAVKYFDYNPANELEVVIDELGNVMYYDHDSMGRVSKEKDYLGQATQYTYDLRGNRTIMVDRRSNAWYWEFDGLSRVTRRRTALLNSTSFNYGASNLLSSQVDPDGNPAYFYYTSQKRLQAKENLVGTQHLLTYFNYTTPGQVQSVKDPLGNTQYFTYDMHHRQTSVKDGVGNVAYTNYDKVGNVSNTIDPRGNTTTNTYDELNRLTATVDALSEANYFYYDVENDQTCSEDALQRRTYYYFDSTNRQFCAEDAQVNRTYFTYEARGLRDSAKDARSNLTYFNFDKLGRQFQVIDARNNQTTTYFDAESNTVAVTDPRVNTTYYTYDNDNKRLTVKTPLGEVTTFGYDAAANQTSVVDALSRASYFYFDSLNRQFCAEDAKQARTYYTFDAASNRNSIKDPLLRVTYYYFDADNRNHAVQDALAGFAYYTFDKSSNRDSVKDQRVNITYFDFDAISRMIRTKSPVAGVTTFGFDKAGNRTSVVDPLSRNNYFYYDTLNRLQASEDGLQKRTYFTYDAVSNQISIKNPRLGSEVGVQYFTYDQLNRRSSFKNEVGNTFYFDYDAASNLQTQINPLAALTYWHYDALNRQSLRKDPLARQWYWGYDAVGNTSKMVDGKSGATYHYYDSVNLLTRTYYAADVVIHYWEYDNARQQTAMADPTGRTTFGYDNLGRMTSRVNPGSQALYYQFDAASNRTSLKDPDGYLFQYVYDAANRMTDAMTAGFGLQPYGQSLYGGYASYYQYDLANQLVHERRQNLSITYFGYDAAGRQSLIQHRKSDGTVIERFDYTRDEAGNIITQQADRVANTIYTYWNYDAANRVTKEAWRTSGGSNVYGFTYVYDAAGNRQSKTDTIASASTYWEYDSADQLSLQRQGGTAKVYFSYDSDGNVSVEEDVDATAPKKTNYTYDQRNLLTQVAFPNNSPVTNYFYYNALSERTRKDDSTAQKKYTWDGIDVVVEKNLSNTTTQRLVKGYTMIPGIGAYAHQDVGTGNSVFPHKNQVGTTMRHTDPTQAVVNYYEYDAWGQPLEAHEANSQQYRFTQKELDPDALTATNVNNRQYHFPFRRYVPFRGGFLQADPQLVYTLIQFASNWKYLPIGNPQYFGTRNEQIPGMYGYVNGNPVKWLDPLGLWVVERKGEARAQATPERNLDTIQDLAMQIGLVAEEFRQWLRFEGCPQIKLENVKIDEHIPAACGCIFTVPNTGYIDAGSYSWGFLGYYLMNAKSDAEKRWTDEGLRVVYTNTWSLTKQLVLEHLAADDIYKYAYIGHGAAGALTGLSDPVGNGVIAAHVYTKYSIHSMALIACQTHDSFTTWAKNVAPVGKILTVKGDLTFMQMDYQVDRGRALATVDEANRQEVIQGKR